MAVYPYINESVDGAASGTDAQKQGYTGTEPRTASTLYVSDLDGTLLGSNGALSGFALKTLNAMLDGGLLFTVATARAPYSAASKLEALRLNVPGMLMNGAMEYNFGSGAVAQLITLSSDETYALADAIRAHGAEPFIYTFACGDRQRVHARGIASPEQRAFVTMRLDEGDKRFNIGGSWTEALGERVFYITTVGPRAQMEALEHIPRDAGLPYCLYEDTYTRAYMLEVGGKGATKRDAVLRLKRRFGARRLVVFGDNLNDLGMMEAADYAVATANAIDDVKAAADEIAGSCDDDGVVKWLMSHAWA